MKIGFIGLGNLGRAIAGRLIKEGAELHVWNRTISKAGGLDATVASNPAALLQDCRIIVLNLFDSDAVLDVLKSEDGLLSGPFRGATIIDTTTNRVEQVKSFHSIVHSAGGSYIEAPVLGSVIPASQGALTVLVSGEEPAFAQVLPLVQKIGNRIFFLGKPGTATILKLVNNMVLGSFMTTLAESVAFAERAGIPRERTLEILASGAGNSTVLNGKREKLLTLDFSPQFSSKAIVKDLHYLNELGEKLGRLPVAGGNALAAFERAVRSGIGEEDFAAVYKVFAGQ
jgi:3-hydroxyisobutyrate dehydrogenase